MDIDFGYDGAGNGTNANAPQKNGDGSDTTDLSTGKVHHNPDGVSPDDVTDLDDNKSKDGNKTGDDNKASDANKDNDKDGNKDDKNKNTQDDTTKEDLVPGTTIEIGDDKYTVDEKGNLVREDGSIFKEANEVKDFLSEYEQVSDEDGLSINSIMQEVGIVITDDNDKPIEFENTPAGVKAYVDAVLETARDENFETAINTLYEKYPFIEDVLNYYIANGNSLEGFGEMPDRSDIVIDDTNEAQQEAIIRAAWSEQGRKGDVESYIAYLKSSGILLATAKEELAGLQEADEQYRKELEAEAERNEQNRIKDLKKYWDGVHEVVNSRNIAGYQIPETIIVNRNGQKISATPEDFFNYMYRVNDKGKSAYVEDLERETPESRRDDEILRAYLKFVGGNYSNLVDMAINKKEVDKLRLRAKERNKPTVRISKPTKSATKGIDIDLGYN